MMPAVCQLLAVLLLLSTPMWIPQASAEGQAAAAAGGLDAGGAVADFEGQLVQEAVDLSSINSESGQQQGEGVLDDAKNLESLLHWAIGESFGVGGDLWPVTPHYTTDLPLTTCVCASVPCCCCTQSTVTQMPCARKQRRRGVMR